MKYIKFHENFTPKENFRVDITYKGKAERFDVVIGNVTELDFAEDERQFVKMVRDLNRRVVECDADGNEI